MLADLSGTLTHMYTYKNELKLGFYTHTNEISLLKINLFFHVLNSIIHNSQNMEQSKYSSMGKSIKYLGYKHKYYLSMQ